MEYLLEKLSRDTYYEESFQENVGKFLRKFEYSRCTTFRSSRP